MIPNEVDFMVGFVVDDLDAALVAVQWSTFVKVVWAADAFDEPSLEGWPASSTGARRSGVRNRPGAVRIATMARADLNRRHHGFQPCALPTELPRRGDSV